jgi:Icc-related predicted phosphoesterase
MNRVIKYLTIPIIAGAIAFSGCSKKEEAKEISIQGSAYSISANDIVQTKSSFLNDGAIKIGVVSDIEGAIQNAKTSANKLKSQNLDAVIIAGDCYENEEIRRNPVYPNSTNNLQEMVDGIEPYAELGVPVFVIAGNHEVQSVYNKAVKKLQKMYPNIFDINERSVDLKGANIVGMGGYHHPGFTPRNGFLLSNSDYSRAKEDLKELQVQEEPTIFVTHGPPKSKTLIDYVQGAGHVGDKNIQRIMDSSNLEGIINIHGHIHEGGRNSDKCNSGIAINIAAIADYNNQKGANTGLISIRDGKASYNEVK